MILKAFQLGCFSEKELLDFASENEKTQVMPLSLFKGERHLLHSVNQTLKAFSQHENIAKTQSLEFLLRFLGERQISKLASKVHHEKKCFFVSWSDNEDRILADFVKRFGAKEIKFPKVSEEDELNTIQRTATFYLDK